MKDNINFTGRIIAFTSFGIGTIFLSFYLYYGETVVNLFAALLFIIVALITNTVILAVLFSKAVLNKIDRLQTLKTVIIMLLNIPIAVLYFYMIITFPGRQLLL